MQIIKVDNKVPIGAREMTDGEIQEFRMNVLKQECREDDQQDELFDKMIRELVKQGVRGLLIGDTHEEKE